MKTSFWNLEALQRESCHHGAVAYQGRSCWTCLAGWGPDSVSPFTFVMQPEKSAAGGQKRRVGVGVGWGDGGPPIDPSVEYSGSSLSNAWINSQNNAVKTGFFPGLKFEKLHPWLKSGLEKSDVRTVNTGESDASLFKKTSEESFKEQWRPTPVCTFSHLKTDSMLKHAGSNAIKRLHPSALAAAVHTGSDVQQLLCFLLVLKHQNGVKHEDTFWKSLSGMKEKKIY